MYQELYANAGLREQLGLIAPAEHRRDEEGGRTEGTPQRAAAEQREREEVEAEIDGYRADALAAWRKLPADARSALADRKSSHRSHRC